MKKKTKLPQLFYLDRHVDNMGVSGTGHVLDGVIFPNGQVVICWRDSQETNSTLSHSSLTIYQRMSHFIDIHVKPHKGASKIVFLDVLSNENEDDD